MAEDAHQRTAKPRVGPLTQAEIVRWRCFFYRVCGLGLCMRAALWLLLCSVMALTACAVPPSITLTPPLYSYTSVTPSATGTPNSVTVFGNYEYVSVQQAGQIFTYNYSSGSQVQVGKPYATPCNSPNGMAVVPEGSSNIMVVACYDTDSVLTLNIAANGSLSPLGSVAVPGQPFPEIAADGTNVFVPLFGTSVSNGGVAKVDVSNPAAPVVTGTVTLASPFPGAVANATALTAASGYIYVASGSETTPLNESSSVQVVNESTMQLVGSPLVVPHSPQQIVVSGGVAYVTLFDAAGLESINASSPASLSVLGLVSPAMPSGCSALALALRNTTAYVGCFSQGTVDRINVSVPAMMTETNSISGLGSPQAMAFSSSYLFVLSSVAGGSVFQMYVGPTN